MDKEFNVIKGSLQNLRTMSTIQFQIVIADGYAVATFSDPLLAKKMVRQENAAGNYNIKFSKQINAAVEQYKGKNKEEITKIIGIKLKKSGAKLE